MGTKKINALRCGIALFLIVVSGIHIGCRGRSSREVRFSYGKILRNEFIYNVGKVVPVAIEQNIEFDGIFSEDGMYLFYASDRERSNFDVYLRALNDITTVRLTAHPAKDISPAISPNGERLAFVSLREDPEGDIFVVDINPAALIDKAAESPSEISTLDSRAKNITQYRDPLSKDIRIIRDSSPAWSPDSSWIAFSSNRDGQDNIWMIDRKGRNLKQITTKGGLYPRFSPDGKKIIFISYRDEHSRGDVYVKNLQTGAETRITSTPHIELYPSFMKNDHEIVYTLIDRDTNKDGAINLKDASIIMYKNIRTGMEYPLTLRSDLSFAPRFSEALRKIKKHYFNVIIFSNQIGENININIIPEEGIIPKKINAQRQYELARSYLEEHDDGERYLLGLERVYHFFGDKKDKISQIYPTKALVEAGKAYLNAKDRLEAVRIGKLLFSISKGKKDYRAAMAQCFSAYLEGKSAERVLAGALDRMVRDSKASEFVPYLLEDLGDEQSRIGKYDAALRTYKKIMDEHPAHGRAEYINFKIAKLQYRAVSPYLPEAYAKAINSEYANVKVAAAKELVRIFSAETNIEKRINAAGAILSKSEKKSGNDVPAMMQYLLGDAYFAKRDYAKAKKYLEEALAGVRHTNFIFYKANKLLGDIAHIRGDFETMEKHYYQNVKNYLLMWKQADFRNILTRLVSYYEDRGAQYLAQKKDKMASNVYEKYIEVVTTAHLLREFGDIYQAYGSRAHVLYIDSFARNSEKEKLITLDEKYSDKLPLARINYDKSYIYGLAYIYAKLAVINDEGQKGGDLSTSLEYFKKSLDQVAWALFMDDTYVEPYILRGWIGQYVDLRRKELGEGKEHVFGKFFPRLLWEANVPLYERALAANDETKNPDAEGNIHLNLANTYFLLNNYPQALRHFEKAKGFKRDFASPVQEALFRFHLGVCYWQNDRIEEAREEMRRTLLLYDSMSQKSGYDRFKEQIYTLYRYFALFDRAERNFNGAISWYNEILDFSEKKKISVDRARMLQEIATCYKEIGNREKAIEYLNRADKILEKETEEERTYKLRFKFLGLGPVSFIDLGPDTVVIGDNRLYTELDTENKKILGFSLREDIHFDRGDYAAAVSYLKKKIALWEEKNHRINKTGKVRALNNIGYCFYKMGLYNNALSYFKQAWDYAAGDDVADMEGMFSAILNYSNLCAMLLERGYDPIPGRYDELFEKISRYRDNYEKQKFEADLEAKKKEARLRKKELTGEDIEALRNQAALSAGEVYHFLDTALGTLKFVRAEHIARPSEGTFAKGESGAYQLYRDNKKLYELYSGAMAHFKSALTYAEKQGNNQAKGKLLLNIAACQEKIGAYEDAYDTLSRAETIADNFEYSTLLWMAQYKLGEFLSKHGAEVEGAGSKRMAREYYEKAVGEIYRCPQCYANHSHHASMLFDGFTRSLLEAGDWREAFSVMEKGYAMVRLMLFSLADRDFHNPSHREKFLERQKIVQDLIAAKSGLTQLLEAGESRDSEKVKNARNAIAQKARALRANDAAHKKDNTLFSSFISFSEQPITPIQGAVVVEFFGLEGKLGAWKLDSTISYSELKATRKEDAVKAVCDYLTAACGSSARRCFVVLNETALSLFSHGNLKQFPAFTFVPSFERAKYYTGQKIDGAAALYGASRRLAQLLRAEKSLSGAVVDEYKEAGADLSRYSLLVGGSDEHSVEPQALLQRKPAPGLYVSRASANSFERIMMAAESSLYAGMKGLLVHDISDEGKLAKLIAAFQNKPLGSAVREMEKDFVLPFGRGLKE